MTPDYTTCGRCDGMGDTGWPPRECPACEGMGVIWVPRFSAASGDPVARETTPPTPASEQGS